MDARTKPCFQHVAHYGQARLESHVYTGPVPASFTFNSPVGVWMPYFMHTQDRQVFIADSTYNIVHVFEY